MRIWRELLWRLAEPVCTIASFARHRNLWGIRDVIHAEPGAHPILERVYKNHLARKGSWIGPNRFVPCASTNAAARRRCRRMCRKT